MSDYRRGLICSLKKDDSPKMILRYNVKEQNLSNSDLSFLKDLSGNGRNMQLYGFSGTDSSGINSDNELVFDGVKDCGIINNLPILSDFTILIKRRWIGATNIGALVSKSNSQYDYGAFFIESHINDAYKECRTRSYGGKVLVQPSQKKEPIIYMTPNSYNGLTINKGSGKDKTIMLLGIEYPQSRTFANFAFSSLVLYNKTLTEDEIEEAKLLL